MSERAYRQRLDADLARWQVDGVITPATGAAIRGALSPLSPAVNIATVVGIVGGLLIAAAFLVFIAANWTAIARPARFAILLAGIVGSYGLGAAFARGERKVLADIAVSAGSIVFGAAIALVGQMYHLGEDFAAGMMLWSAGALVAAVATGSRGALAVALAAGCIWSGMRMFEASQAPHLPFVAFWLITAGLAVAWNSAVARHLVGVAALAWWGVTQLADVDHFLGGAVPATFAAGVALLLGAGLVLAGLRANTLRLFGLTLSTYGAFGLAIGCTLVTLMADPSYRTAVGVQAWATLCGVGGVLLAFVGAAMVRRAGPAFSGLASGLVLLVFTGVTPPVGGGEPWLAYALLLGAMLCLVVSGMLDEVRPRVVAGWLGLSGTIAAITWAVRGSLLRRAVFLAIAGLIAVGLASTLGKLMPKERPQ
jgi:uncharacterized membrane protein